MLSGLLCLRFCSHRSCQRLLGILLTVNRKNVSLRCLTTRPVRRHQTNDDTMAIDCDCKSNQSSERQNLKLEVTHPLHCLCVNTIWPEFRPQGRGDESATAVFNRRLWVDGRLADMCVELFEIQLNSRRSLTPPAPTNNKRQNERPQKIKNDV